MNWALILPIHPPSHSPDVHTVFELDIRDRVGKRRVPQLWVVVPRRDFERIDNMSGHIWAKPFPEPSQVGPDPLTDWGGGSKPCCQGRRGAANLFFKCASSSFKYPASILHRGSCSTFAPQAVRLASGAHAASGDHRPPPSQADRCGRCASHGDTERRTTDVGDRQTSSCAR